MREWLREIGVWPFTILLITAGLAVVFAYHWWTY